MSGRQPLETNNPRSAVLGDGVSDPEVAHAHFVAKLSVETDPSDVHRNMEKGVDAFTLVDVRHPAQFRECHIRGAVNIPALAISPTTTQRLDRPTLVIVHCWGPGCNGASKAAARLSALGFRVKEMIGGIEYWRRESFPVEGTLGNDAPLVG